MGINHFSIWKKQLQKKIHIFISESESEAAQLCPTLCDPMDCSLPDSFVHGIFQAIVQNAIPYILCKE